MSGSRGHLAATHGRSGAARAVAGLLVLVATLGACAGPARETRTTTELPLDSRTAAPSTASEGPDALSIEAARQASARAAEDDGRGSTLTVTLEVTDPDGAPFSGKLGGFLGRDGWTRTGESYTPGWTQDYYAEAEIEAGEGHLQFDLSALDAVIAVEWRVCELTVRYVDDNRSDTGDFDMYVDPRVGLRAFDERIFVGDLRHVGKGLVTSLQLPLALPPYYGTLEFTRPLQEGDRLLTRGVRNDGSIVPLDGFWSGFEYEMIDLPAGATSVDLYSWSRSNRSGILIFDADDESVAPPAILRFDSSVTIER